MSQTDITFTIKRTNTNKELTVTFNVEILNIHIKDSYQVKTKSEINEMLDKIITNEYFSLLFNNGFTRAKASMMREWKAHNVLYRSGIFKERTGSVDLNQDESLVRRIGYFFLSLL